MLSPLHWFGEAPTILRRREYAQRFSLCSRYAGWTVVGAFAGISFTLPDGNGNIGLPDYRLTTYEESCEDFSSLSSKHVRKMNEEVYITFKMEYCGEIKKATKAYTGMDRILHGESQPCCRVGFKRENL